MSKVFKKVLLMLPLLACAQILFFRSLKLIKKATSQSCGRFPTAADIKIDNKIWQVLEQPNRGPIKIWNAYYDDRQNVKSVKLNIMSPRLVLGNSTFFCQLWFDEESPPLISKTSSTQILWWHDFEEDSKFVIPYFVMCEIPKNESRMPVSVSLVHNACDHAANNVKIIDNKPEGGKRKKFGVCSKAVKYTDSKFVTRFIEWVHWMEIMGAEKIHFSYFEIHPDMMKAVKYFEDKGFVEISPYSEPSGLYEDETRIKEFITEENVYNDCFYRVRNLYEHLAVLDFDEILVPTNESDRNWSDLIKRIDSINATSYDAMVFEGFLMAKNESFVTEVPKSVYTLGHLLFYKAAFDPGKSIIKPDLLLTINTHFPISKIGQQNRFNVPSQVGRVFHYRNDVSERENTETEQAKQLVSYKDELTKKIEKTLTDLKIDAEG